LIRSAPMRTVLSLVALIVAASACKKPAPALVSPREVHTPGVDTARLSSTEAAQQGRSGAVKVNYCIDPTGETRDIEIVESFGDPDVDAIVIETVDAWRYEPATRDGVPVEQCRDYTFELRLGS
jgi:TonB family protein